MGVKSLAYERFFSLHSPTGNFGKAAYAGRDKFLFEIY